MQSNQLSEAVTTLAKELAVPAEKLWDALLQGAAAQKYIAAFETVSVLVLLFIWYRFMKWSLKHEFKDRDDETVVRIISIIVVVILIFISIVVWFASIGSAIQASIAPEMWALQKLFDAVQ